MFRNPQKLHDSEGSHFSCSLFIGCEVGDLPATGNSQRPQVQAGQTVFTGPFAASQIQFISSRQGIVLFSVRATIWRTTGVLARYVSDYATKPSKWNRIIEGVGGPRLEGIALKQLPLHEAQTDKSS